MTDDNGSATVLNTYDEWGIPDKDDPSDPNDSYNEGRFQYTGQVYSPYVGMYYYEWNPTAMKDLEADLPSRERQRLQ